MRPRPIVALAFGVCIASQPALAAPRTPGDPFETANRGFFTSQSGFDKHIFRPLAHAYHTLTPGLIGKAVHNVLTNLSEPVVIVNDILQLRLKRAAHDTLRLTANTTAGWLGLMDVATPAGLPHHDNDFGVTLGRWGVGPGPYLYLPLIGPSTVRDAFGLAVDAGTAPFDYINFPGRTAVVISTSVLGGLDLRERTEAQEDTLLADAADPYATLRSVYLQNRQALIRGEEATPALPPIDSGTPAPDSAQPPASEPPASGGETPSAAPSPSADLETPAALAGDGPIATARDYAPDITLALQRTAPAA